MDDIIVSINGIHLNDTQWSIDSNNDLQLSVFVTKGDRITVNCGDAYVRFTADGKTNRWHMSMDIEQLKYRSFCDRVYQRRDEPIIHNLLEQLRVAMGLIE